MSGLRGRGWFAIQVVGSSIEFRFLSGQGKIVTGKPGTATGVGSRSK